MHQVGEYTRDKYHCSLTLRQVQRLGSSGCRLVICTWCMCLPTCAMSATHQSCMCISSSLVKYFRPCIYRAALSPSHAGPAVAGVTVLLEQAPNGR
jgi:hypothetical protein